MQPEDPLFYFRSKAKPPKSGGTCKEAKYVERKNPWPGQNWLGNYKAGAKCSGLNFNVRTNAVSDNELSQERSGGTLNKEAKYVANLGTSKAKYVADLGTGSGSLVKESPDNLGQKRLGTNISVAGSKEFADSGTTSSDLGTSSGSFDKESPDNLGQKRLGTNISKKVHLDFLRSVAKCCCRSNITLDSKETRVMQYVLDEDIIFFNKSFRSKKIPFRGVLLATDFDTKSGWKHLDLSVLSKILVIGEEDQLMTYILKEFNEYMALQVLKMLAPGILSNYKYYNWTWKVILSQCVMTKPYEEGRRALIILLGTLVNRVTDVSLFPIDSIHDIWEIAVNDHHTGYHAAKYLSMSLLWGLNSGIEFLGTDEQIDLMADLLRTLYSMYRDNYKCTKCAADVCRFSHQNSTHPVCEEEEVVKTHPVCEEVVKNKKLTPASLPLGSRGPYFY
jgi:hypothetical protein